MPEFLPFFLAVTVIGPRNAKNSTDSVKNVPKGGARFGAFWGAVLVV